MKEWGQSDVKPKEFHVMIDLSVKKYLETKIIIYCASFGRFKYHSRYLLSIF